MVNITSKKNSKIKMTKNTTVISTKAKSKTAKTNIKKQPKEILKVKPKENVAYNSHKFKVHNEEYNMIPVYKNLHYKLNNVFKVKSAKAVLIAPTHQERNKLISQIIGHYAVNQLGITARFYYISELTWAVFNKIYKQKIPDMDNITVLTAIKKIQDFGYKVFLHGGAIRDIFIHKSPTDIDLVFDKDVQSLGALCKAEGWACSIIDPRTQYINFGENKGISLEGDNLKSKFLIPMHNHEVTINDFAYDCQTNILIDISGHGLEDVLFKKIRLSPLPKYWLKWAQSDNIGKKPLRYFKLIQKGFEPKDDGSYEFVVNYIKDNFESFYMEPVTKTYTVPRIKHFLIVNITQGSIDAKTNAYTFGANQNKLIGYLRVIKKHLGSDIFYKIMSVFDDRDLELFEADKVVSSLRRVMKNKKVISAKIEYNNKHKK
jgi:hypothetical protein